MKLEDDPSISLCACPYCGRSQSLPCGVPTGHRVWRTKDGRIVPDYVRSHVARLRLARTILIRQADDFRRSHKGRDELMRQLGVVQSEICRRRGRTASLLDLAKGPITEPEKRLIGKFLNFLRPSKVLAALAKGRKS